MFADEFLPTYDVSGADDPVAAGPAATWGALMDGDLIEVAGARRSSASVTSAEPGYAKIVSELSVRGLEDGGTLLAGLMRTATTDERARRWFRRDWKFGVGSGAHMLVNGVFEQARESAEQAPVS